MGFGLFPLLVAVELDEFVNDDEWDAFCNLPGPAFSVTGGMGKGHGPFDKFSPFIFGIGGGPV